MQLNPYYRKVIFCIAAGLFLKNVLAAILYIAAGDTAGGFTHLFLLCLNLLVAYLYRPETW